MHKHRSKKDKLLDFLAAHSRSGTHELISCMLDDLGLRGTIEATTVQVGRWMEQHGLCADYRDVLDERNGS